MISDFCCRILADRLGAVWCIVRHVSLLWHTLTHFVSHLTFDTYATATAVYAFVVEMRGIQTSHQRYYFRFRDAVRRDYSPLSVKITFSDVGNTKYWKYSGKSKKEIMAIWKKSEQIRCMRIGTRMLVLLELVETKIEICSWPLYISELLCHMFRKMAKCRWIV